MSARIIDTAIQVTERTDTTVSLLLGVDTVFTGSDLSDAQTGAARYEMQCVVWDDDSFFNDRITSAVQVMEPGRILQVTGVDMPFVLSLEDLNQREPRGESTIELFGRFTLRRNGRSLGSVDTSNLDIPIP